MGNKHCGGNKHRGAGCLEHDSKTGCRPQQEEANRRHCLIKKMFGCFIHKHERRKGTITTGDADGRQQTTSTVVCRLAEL
jgi:hypothetical protein